MPHEQANEEVDGLADDATFGDIDGIGENSESNDDMILDNPDDWSHPIEVPKVKGNKKSTDQVENLEVEEGEVNGKGTKITKSKKEDDEETDEELEAKETKVAKDEPEETVVEDDAPVGKLLKVKIGGRESVIDDGAVVRHKVDGKMVDVKISDALKEYSGKQNWDRKNQEFAVEKKTMTAKVQQVQQYEAHLKKEMGEVERLVKEAVEGKATPFAAMEKLLDSLGQDSFVYYKKVMESLFADFEQLYDMDEHQQKAYWTAKENEHLKKGSERTRISQQREQENHRVVSQAEAAQDEFGVGWEEFNDALDDLSYLKDSRGILVYQEKALMANPRAVAQYAAKKPYITKAETLIKPFEDNIDDDKIVDLTDEVVKLLHGSKGASEAEVKEWLETNYGVSPTVKALNQRLQKSGGAAKVTDKENSKYKVKTRPKAEDEVEDWDDFDT